MDDFSLFIELFGIEYWTSICYINLRQFIIMIELSENGLFQMIPYINIYP